MDTDTKLPEVNECFVDYERCIIHGHNYVSMPRNEGEQTAYEAKCPIKSCWRGRTKSV